MKLLSQLFLIVLCTMQLPVFAQDYTVFVDEQEINEPALDEPAVEKQPIEEQIVAEEVNESIPVDASARIVKTPTATAESAEIERLINTGTLKKYLQNPNMVSEYYLLQFNQPQWQKKDKQIKQLISVIEHADQDGLLPEAYHYTQLKYALDATDAKRPEKWAVIDILLTDAFISYAVDMVEGRASIKRTDKNWLLKGRQIDANTLLETTLASGIDVTLILKDLAPKHMEYQRLKKVLASFTNRGISYTTVSSGSTLRLGQSHARVAELKARLRQSGDLTTEVGDFEEEQYFDEDLRSALASFQRSKKLGADGIAGPKTISALNKLPPQGNRKVIEVNMERWRWMPADMGKRYLVVDLTDYEMYVVVNGKEIHRDIIVVGTQKRQTPVFSADMTYLVFSPYWGVPKSLAVKDKLPSLRRDPYSLARQNIRVFDRKNHEIDPGSVNWSQYGEKNFPFYLRQDPGNRNALGKVKFMFPNDYAIYLHDTPNKQLFQRKERSYSSGCIRVSRPLDLANLLLKDDPRWNAERVKAAYSGNKERTVKFNEEEHMKVYILYLTAWVNADGGVDFRRDIYNRDEAMIKRIKELEVKANSQPITLE